MNSCDFEWYGPWLKVYAKLFYSISEASSTKHKKCFEYARKGLEFWIPGDVWTLLGHLWDVFAHSLQGYLTVTRPATRLPWCRWGKPKKYWQNQSLLYQNKTNNKVQTRCTILEIFIISMIIFFEWQPWTKFIAMMHNIRELISW